MIYKLRIHHSRTENCRSSTLYELHDMMKTYIGDEYIISMETKAKNGAKVDPHIHALIIPKDLKKMKEFNKETFGKGNKIWSMSKQKEPEWIPETIAYVMKEGKYISNLPEQVRLDAEEIVAEFKKKTDKRKVKNILQDLRDVIAEDKKKYKDYTVDHIIVKVVEYYRDKKSLIREFQLKCYVQTLSLEFVPYYENELHRRLRKMILEN